MGATSYNPRKAAQVIAYLAMKQQGRMPVLKAVKLVYLADRESLARFGFSILDESYVSMPHGPVSSCSYDRINRKNRDDDGWNDFLRDRSGNDVAVVDGIAQDDLDELSDADIACLDTVWDKFGRMNHWQIRDWTRDRANIPEWEDPGGCSQPIPLERVLKCLNVPEADDQADLIREYREIDRTFANLR